MRSDVAEQIRDARRARELAATPEERMRMALDAGDRLVAMIAAKEGIDLAEARERIRAQGHRGRRLCSWQREQG